MASYFHLGVCWHFCKHGNTGLQVYLRLPYLFCNDQQPSCCKLFCLFENLYCRSTPSETADYAATTTGKQREYFESKKIQEISHEHISRFHFIAVLLHAFFIYRLFSIYRCDYFTKRFRHSFYTNFLELICKPFTVLLARSRNPHSRQTTFLPLIYFMHFCVKEI